MTDPLFGVAEASFVRSHIRQKWGGGNGSSRMKEIETATESFNSCHEGKAFRGLCQYISWRNALHFTW